MKNALAVGVILIILGVIALAYQGFTYTKKDKIVDAGPIQLSATHEKSVPIPPIIGAAAIIGGVVLVAVGARKS